MLYGHPDGFVVEVLVLLLVVAVVVVGMKFRYF